MRAHILWFLVIFFYIAGSNPIMKVQVRDSRDEVPNDYYNNDTMDDYKIKENEKPCLTGDGLYFRPSSPHEYNNYSETISCEATAKDPNDDKISYRFILNCLNCREDRNHDSKWELKKPKNNTYPWTPSRKDIGEWNITVCIRDGNHADDNRGMMIRPAKLITSPRSYLIPCKSQGI